ncbi:MAG: HTTM domain-containing protein [Bacteroidota bacterium]
MNRFQTYIQQQTNAAPLAIFRIGFGLMMCYGIIRFWAHGWIESVYLEPDFHFKYYGFAWVKPLGNFTYVLFIICGVSAFLVALGLKYRLAIITFFLSFTYIELMEKTTYLNHYYFISILSFLMIFLPANAMFSVDNLWRKRSYENIPKWTIDGIKLLLGIVYFYAGLAKLNADWLLKAQPLKIWLPSKFDLPIIGKTVMQQEWFHYAMSWSGMLYDLLIPFLLLYRKTRVFAFALVVFFHVFTRVLFPIGMFPFVMIVSTLIFFDANFHLRVISYIKTIIASIVKIQTNTVQTLTNYKLQYKSVVLSVVIVFFVIQLLFPFRFMLYPGNLFWTEQGYRFSWRVMLMEKKGLSTFKIVDGETGNFFYVNNSDFLTNLQEKQMSFQPDFILEYAHYLGDHFKSQGHKNVEVYVESHVALNGRMSQLYIDKTVDLYKIKESFTHKNWIVPFKEQTANTTLNTN